MAQPGPLDELQRARRTCCAAQIAFARRRGSDAPPLLLKAAQRLEPLDAELARETYLDAFAAALSAGRLAHGGDARGRRRRPRRGAGSPPRARATCCSTDWRSLTTDGYAAGAPPLKEALRAFRDEAISEEEELRWLWLACRIARALGRRRGLGRADRPPGRARSPDRRAVRLPIALNDRFNAALFSGQLALGDGAGRRGGSGGGGDRQPRCPARRLALATWRGRRAEARR